MNGRFKSVHYMGRAAVLDTATGDYAVYGNTRNAQDAAELLNSGQYTTLMFFWTKPVSTQLAARIAKGEEEPSPYLVRKLAWDYLQQINRRKRAEGGR